MAATHHVCCLALVLAACSAAQGDSTRGSGARAQDQRGSPTPTLDRVRRNGFVRCGVSTGIAGFSAPDARMVKEVLDTMVGLAREGMTMLCVTHEMGFARLIADRVVFMDGGRIVEVAEPAAFFTAPRHERARIFLGQVLQ